MNRNLKFAIGQFVVFMAGAGLCELVTMHVVMGVMLLAELVAAYEIYKALPRKVATITPATQSTQSAPRSTSAPATVLFDPQDITREFLIKNDGKLAWIRWDWLSMSGIIPASDVKTNALLDRVVEVKKAAEDDGIVFTG